MTFTGTPPESPQKIPLVGERQDEECKLSSEALQLLQPPLIKSNPSKKKQEEGHDHVADFIVKLANSISESFVMIQKNTKDAATKFSKTTKIIVTDIQERCEEKKKAKTK